MDNIWWFATRNWLYKKEYKILPEEREPVSIAITSPIDSWMRRVKDNPDYIVFIITEPILLLMLNEDYSTTIEEKIISKLHPGNHSILLDSTTFSGEIKIFEKRYYYRYLYCSLHEFHRKAHYSAIKEANFQKTGDLSFQQYFSSYIVKLVLYLVKAQEKEEADKILKSVGELFSDSEKQTLLESNNALSSDEMAFSDEDEWNEETLDEFPFSDSDVEEEQLNNNPDHRKIGSLNRCWNDVKKYLDLYGRGRIEKESKKLLISRLDDKIFYGVIECLDLIPQKEGVENYIDKMHKIVSELKDKSELNVVPFFSADDLYEYLDGCIGNRSNVVYNHYILRSQLLADELDRLLSLFEEYLTVVRGLNVKFEKETSVEGIIYTIRSNSPELTKENCVDVINEFRDLLVVVSEGTVDIQKLVETYNLPPDKAESIVRKYSFEYKKLLIDLKYELPKKLLQLRKDAEEECLIESMSVSDQQMLVNRFKDPSAIMITNNYYNIDKQMLTIIEGDFHYTPYDKAIIDSIRKYGNENQAELIDALKTLKDEGIEVRVREKEQNKLLRFFAKVAEIGAGAAFGAAADATIPRLIEYLKGLIG